MNLDSLSVATIIVSIIVIILVFGAIIYSHITTKNNMRTLARNTILMNADDEIKDLCKQIMDIKPNACPLMHGDALKLVKADPEKLKSILREQLASLKNK